MTGEGIALAQGSDNHVRSRPLQNDSAAFEELIALNAPRIRRLAYRLLGWRDDAEDVVQDVFLAALRRIERFRGDASIATWLTTITINRCRTHRRRQLLQMRWLARFPKSRDAAPADQPSIDEEASSRTRAAVRALRPRDREVIVLFYLEDETAAQIAEMLGISRGAVELRLHRARARLKGTLADLVSD